MSRLIHSIGIRLIMLPFIILCTTVHEFGHAYMARLRGDNTATALGRLSLNPIAHFSLFGTIAFLFLGVGWAKPVPINPHNFKNLRLDDFLVSIAGVANNLIFAAICGVFLAVLNLGEMGKTGYIVQQILYIFVYINCILLIFNLLPFPPLDGSHIIVDIFPGSAIIRKIMYNQYVFYILFAFAVFVPEIFNPVFSVIISKPTEFLVHLLTWGKY